MGLYSDPPPVEPFSEAKPTLLVAWWITIFCTCLIFLRLAGRYIRIEKLFIEDKIAALSLLPLYARMGCIHVVLLFGTNNVQVNATASQQELDRREIGSRLVLAARIFFTATLWILKLTSLEFISRIAKASMEKLHLRLIIFLRYALGATFLAVIISDLVECQPITHYWQVLPDPGPQCRQGYAQLLTAGVSSALIDTILVIIPIPIVLSTRITPKRKVLLVMLFCLGFLTVGIAAYRMPIIIRDHGSQVTRSTWASVELLAATTVANLVALGSFLRDSGVKKKRFRPSHAASGGSSSNRRLGQNSALGDYDAKVLSQQAGMEESDEENWDPYYKSDDAYNHHGNPHIHSPPLSSARAGFISPTASHDSLILHTHHPLGAGTGIDVGRNPELTQPRPVVPARIRGFSRGR